MLLNVESDIACNELVILNGRVENEIPDVIFKLGESSTEVQRSLDGG